VAALKISNRNARELWLQSHGLGSNPVGTLDAISVVKNLGFVQLDTIQIVSRAHHHIMWSRNQNYREPMMDRMLGRDRLVFEHFTHDASVLPMEYLPMWRRQFRRMEEKVSKSSWYGNALDDELLSSVMRRVADEGPLCTRDFDTKPSGPKQMWQRPPHKKALDYLWYSGQLATCHRDGFTKYYDLAERVFPEDVRRQEVADQAQLDGLCGEALRRLGIGALGEGR